MDNEKFQELVLQQLGALASDVAGLKQDIVGVKDDIQDLKSAVTKIEVRIENEVIEKIRALYDARSVQGDINTRIIDTLDRIEAKLDVLQMETAHIRRVRRNRSI